MTVGLDEINKEIVLENTVLFGSVNASRRNYEQAATALAAADRGWLQRLITRRVPMSEFAEACGNATTTSKSLSTSAPRRVEVTHAFSTGLRSEGPLEELAEEGRRRVWTWAAVIALGGFLFGYDTGVVSGALLFIKTDFHLNAFEQGSVVSVLLLGAMAGALGSGRVADPLGRRKTLGLEGLLFIVGTALAVFATGYPMLLLARIVLGLAVGGASATVPVYLGEVAPATVRGRVLTLNQLMITIGIMVAYLVNLAFSGAGDWRAMFAVGVLPALAIVAGALWLLPESPQWLLTNGRDDQARRVMAQVAGAPARRASHRAPPAARAPAPAAGC